MNEPLRVHIANSLEPIPAASEVATRWLESREVAPGATYLAELTIEELVSNCIKHGYDDNLEHQIEIELSIKDGEMVLVVLDDGHEFNPLEFAEPDTNLPIEDRPLGGLGIHLLRKMSDRMKYERRDGRNQVTVMKKAV